MAESEVDEFEEEVAVQTAALEAREEAQESLIHRVLVDERVKVGNAQLHHRKRLAFRCCRLQ